MASSPAVACCIWSWCGPKKIKQIACADPIPTLAQAREAFVAWAAGNAEHMASKPIDGFWRAMAATYPCPK